MRRGTGLGLEVQRVEDHGEVHQRIVDFDSVTIVRRFNNQCVAVPIAARITKPLPDLRFDRRSTIPLLVDAFRRPQVVAA